MIKLKSDISITLSGRTYNCHLFLGMYASSTRPCLVLVGAEDGQVLTKATVNPPLGFLTGFHPECFCWKDWAENEGLQAQLQDLTGNDGLPLFLPVTRKDGSTFAITLGYCKSQIYALNGVALNEYMILRKGFHESQSKVLPLDHNCADYKSVFTQGE